MAESFLVNTEGSKETIYRSLLGQAKALRVDGDPAVSNVSNLLGLLQQTFDWWWVGFYLVSKQELVLGPFQGPVACTRIGFGKGVCGKSWELRESLIVPDVHQFPGHIACSSESRSELVIPVWFNQEVIAVLDIDSEKPDHFDETDRNHLEQLLPNFAADIEKLRLSV